MNHSEFAKQLRAIAGTSVGWPFVCDGSPFDCQIALVGINPATDVPLWPNWSNGAGVNKAGWLQDYITRYKKYTPTRARIERLVKAIAPARVLETNIIHHYSARESDLPKELRRSTEVFDYLIATLKPKVLLVHGRSAVRHLQRLTSTDFVRGEFASVRYRNVAFDVLAHHHLSYQWSFAKVDELGRTLRRRLEAVPAV